MEKYLEASECVRPPVVLPLPTHHREPQKERATSPLTSNAEESPSTPPQDHPPPAQLGTLTLGENC